MTLHPHKNTVLRGEKSCNNKRFLKIKNIIEIIVAERLEKVIKEISTV